MLDWESVSWLIVTWMQVQIPKDSVGIVIGRQGANIKEIQVQSSLVLNQEFHGPGYLDLRPIQWFVCRPRLRQGSTSKMSLRRKSTGWLPSGRLNLNWKLFPCESHGSLESFSWATLLMLKLITGAARMGLRWLRSSFTKPSLNSQGSDNHRLDLHCHEFDSWLLYQGGDRCAGSANPKRGKSDWPERRDGEEEILFPSCTSPSCKPLYKDLAILPDLLLICSGEGHQQGEQMQSGRGVRNQGWNC